MRVKKIKKATFSKHFKMGLPGYSNVTVGMRLTVDVAKGEKLDTGAIWDMINQELGNAVDFDPSWIKNESFKKHYRLTIKIPK
jgi:hypothetical protein